MNQPVEDRPAVNLNHFFLCVDSATANAIAGSAFLKEHFAPYERRTTIRADRTYTGQYFYGTNTYFEIFDVSQEPARTCGDSAIAFGVDELGGLDRLEQQIDSTRVPVTRTSTTRRLGEADIGWFQSLVADNLPRSSRVASWIMEYQPAFLGEWHPEADDHRGVTRREILRRYTGVVGGSPASPLMQDVVGLTIAAEPSVSTHIVRWCEQLGYRISGTDGVRVLRGPNFALRLIPATDSARGIVEARFQIRQSLEHQKMVRVGPSSTLVLGTDGTATWSF